jgi:hypothetical protein
MPIDLYYLSPKQRHFICSLLTVLLVGFLSKSVHAQSEDPEEAPIQVMVLGTFHFTGTPDFNAISDPEQQEELKELNNALARFSPNKIALEFERKEAAKADSLYQAYRKGEHELNINERQQIGFRLSKRLDLPHVYSIDFKKPWGMDTVMSWAQQHRPEFLDYFKSWQKNNQEMDSVLHQTKTIPEILKVYNSDSLITEIQKARMTTLEVGAGDNYIGVKPVASVYERNMRIFANLLDIAEPGDRILIVYGAGHTYFFHRFIEQHPDMELIPVSDYL